MNRLKSIFHLIYFTYLFFSVLMFSFRASLFQQMDPEFLDRFIDFWIIMGFILFISIWIIQAIHISFLKKDLIEHEGEILELKSKLYDISRNDLENPVEEDSDISVSTKATD